MYKGQSVAVYPTNLVFTSSIQRGGNFSNTAASSNATASTKEVASSNAAQYNQTNKSWSTCSLSIDQKNRLQIALLSLQCRITKTIKESVNVQPVTFTVTTPRLYTAQRGSQSIPRTSVLHVLLLLEPPAPLCINSMPPELVPRGSPSTLSFAP